MTQQNVNTGKTRKIRRKNSHRGSDAGAVHVHALPVPSAPPAPPVTPSDGHPTPASSPGDAKADSGRKTGVVGRVMRFGAKAGGLAVLGAGLVVVGGVCDIGDITDFAEEA